MMKRLSAVLLLCACDLDDADLRLSSGTGDGFGWQVTGQLHVDNDSQPDLAIASVYDDTVYFFSDITSGGNATISSASGQFNGLSGGEAGWSMDVGPLVGAGLAGVLMQDIVIGAPSEASGKGRLYVLEGGDLDQTINATGYVTFLGENNADYAGWDVEVGDFNGDEIQDILIGAPGDDTNATDAGSIYVVYGPFSSVKGTEVDLANADVIIRGEQLVGYFGREVAAGDLNNDGQDEIIVAGVQESGGGLNYNGQVHAIFEHSTGEFDLSDLSSATVTWTGRFRAQNLGTSMSSGEDFDGDGVEDLAVSGWFEFCTQHVDTVPNGTCSATIENGEAYLIRGIPSTISQSVFHNSGQIHKEADVIFSSSVADNDFGVEVTLLDDVNGDGLDDLAIGAKGDNQAYMWIGRSTTASYWSSSFDETDANVTISGTTGDSGVGTAISNGGDINGDGIGEVIIGSPGFDWIYQSSSGARADIYLGALKTL